LTAGNAEVCINTEVYLQEDLSFYLVSYPFVFTIINLTRLHITKPHEKISIA